MEAIILASGVGRRLGAFGKKKPKCLLNLTNKLTIIDKILLELKEIKKIYIIVGYKKELIENYLSNSKKKINFIYNKEFRKKGNFFSALICDKLISKNFILLDADIILPTNSLKKFIKDKRKNLVMTNPKNKYDSDDIILNLNKKKIIDSIWIKKKNLNFSDKFASAGVIKISKSAKKIFFKELKRILRIGNQNSYYENAYNLLFKNVPFQISPLKKNRLEIDTIKDYKKVLKILKRRNVYV